MCDGPLRRGEGNRPGRPLPRVDESSYVTGTEFLVDGGLTAAYVTRNDMRYLEDFAAGQKFGSGVCGSRRSGSSPSPRNIERARPRRSR